MQTIECNTPSGTLTINKPDCIGKFYILFFKACNCRVLANCIDATPEGKPKRMRIQQHLAYGGNVLMPYEYDILEENVAWED